MHRPDVDNISDDTWDDMRPLTVKNVLNDMYGCRKMCIQKIVVCVQPASAVRSRKHGARNYYSLVKKTCPLKVATTVPHLDAVGVRLLRKPLSQRPHVLGNTNAETLLFFPLMDTAPAALQQLHSTLV